MRFLPFAALLIASASFAQSPQLLVREGETQHPIALARADIHAVINGYLSQTSMTLTFRNDADRVLEGELVFPLPENATVCAYALDVNGELVDAVTVEKEKARVAFETEVRRGIDPGLVEKVTGNNFRTRIYPIPAKGTRTIRVQYVSDLTAGDGSTLSYVLPLKWDQPVAQASIRIEVIKSPVEPKLAEGKIEKLSFTKWEDRFVAEQKLADATFNTTLKIALPDFPASSVAIDKRTRSTVSFENVDPKMAGQFVKTDYFFLINNRPPQSIDRLIKIEKPRRIAIAWDASMSRTDQDHARERAILEKHLKSLGNVSVDLMVFRNVPEPTQSFSVKDADASAILKAISAITYDGGTSLANLSLTRGPGPEGGQKTPRVDYWLLFTDGLANLGADLPAKVECPVYAVAVDPKSNHGLLRHLSSSSGGAYLNLNRMTDDQALAAIGAKPFSLMSIQYNKDEIAEIVPPLPQAVQGGRVAIAGRLLAKTAKVTLVFGLAGQETSREEITLSQDQAADAGLVGRFWAQLKLADLSVMENKNEAEITSLGKEFNLVTSFTSMIVLESTDQYLRHKIVPPKSRPQIYAEFMKRIEQQHLADATNEKAKIDRVLAMWTQRVKWWNTEFKYPRDLKVKIAEAKQGASTGRSGGGLFGAGAAPAPAADGAHPAARPPATPAANTPRPAEPLARTGDEVGRLNSALRDPQAERPSGGRAFRGDGELKDSKGDSDDASKLQATIAIKEWTPDTPYLKALRTAKIEDAYAIYLDQSKTLRSSPAFFLDCADFFAKANKPDLALRTLTNIPELGLDDGRLLRIAAHRFQQLGRLDLAIDLFEKVTKLRPEEPQSFRDLALALADRADARAALQDFDRARSDYETSLSLLHKVVMNQWQRFEEIELIALMDANRIFARILGTQHSSLTTLRNPFDPRLIKLLDLDLRISLTWDSDNTDIDLHVIEPSGEECNYSHNRTTIGGLVSRDFTQGYGPEEYCLKKLMAGKYQIKAHFYGNRDQKLLGPTTVQATIITNFGRPDEKRQAMTLRLTDTKEMVEIGTVTLNP